MMSPANKRPVLIMAGGTGGHVFPALAVATEAVASGVAGVSAGTDLGTTVDEAMWWPSYVPYIRSRASVHREEVYVANEAFRRG